MSAVTRTLALGLSALLLGSHVGPPPVGPPPIEPPPIEEAGGAPFVAFAGSFADAGACAAHLATWVRDSAPPAYDAAVGPYAIAVGDVRAHRVAARGWAHEIEEHRCLGAALSGRRWTHGMNDVQPITLDDIRKMSFPAQP